MKWLQLTLPIFVFFLFIPVFAPAQQNKDGNIVIHADPRLQLLKKYHSSYDDNSTPVAEIRKDGKPEFIKPTVVKKDVKKGTIRISTNLSTDNKANNKNNSAPSDSVNNSTISLKQSGLQHHTSKGFRVQIYNGPDHQKAEYLKKEFSKRFPKTRIYLVYSAPSFRLKAGDFSNHNEAATLLKQVKSISNLAMIVQDNINP